jgi:cystathionine gamma-lyase
MPSDSNESFAWFLHQHSKDLRQGEAVNPPITMSTVYALPDGTEADHRYGRWSNPTWTALEDSLSILENANAVAFPSGMAATASVLFSLLGMGDRILLPADGYYTTRTFAEHYLGRFGVGVDTYPTAELASRDLTEYKLVWIETPSNPRLDLVDIADVAHRSRNAGAVLVADNTTMTPLGQRPLDLGADIVVSSDTKAMNGHSDVVFGHIATRNDGLLGGMRDWRSLAGSIPGPFESWLVHRGLETLEVRFNRMCANAQAIADHLMSSQSVDNVIYPGLPSHPQHELAKKQMSLFGSVAAVSFPDETAAERFIARCRLIRPTTSFGGIHTSAERRARWGDDVPAGFVRLSVGAEPLDQLLAALDGAL